MHLGCIHVACAAREGIAVHRCDPLAVELENINAHAARAHRSQRFVLGAQPLDFTLQRRDLVGKRAHRFTGISSATVTSAAASAESTPISSDAAKRSCGVAGKSSLHHVSMCDIKVPPWLHSASECSIDSVNRPGLEIGQGHSAGVV